MKKQFHVGIVGCGMISNIYIKNIKSVFNNVLHVHGVFDKDLSLAQKQAAEYGLSVCYSSSESMFSDPEIDIVLNLCPPAAHYTINKQAIRAGKHVYSEKPLALTFAEGAELVSLAKQHGVFLGCAPDTPLGALVQTARKLVEEDSIGRVIGASANLIKRGVEDWHPNPHFLYQPGAGPLMDMGPYYLAALLHIVGPFESVSAMTSISFPTRKITSQPHYGETIHVNVPTYVNALLQFECGALATFTATFDVWKSKLPHIEIYGSDGTLLISDPNMFCGKIWIVQTTGDYTELPLRSGYVDNSRGIGVADMAYAILNGTVPCTDARYSLHILETMDSILKSAETCKRTFVSTRCGRPAATSGLL